MKVKITFSGKEYPADLSGDELYTEQPICEKSIFQPGDENISAFYATAIENIIKASGKIIIEHKN